MNGLHLQFANLAKETCDFAQDVFYGLGRFCAVHPVVANLFFLGLFLVNFLFVYILFDFIEEKYIPIVKRVAREILIEIKRIRLSVGVMLIKTTKKVVKFNIYLGILMIPVFLIGKTMKGGKKHG